MDSISWQNLVETARDVLDPARVLDSIIVQDVEIGEVHLLEEGKWISKGKIRIDQPTHGAGQPHAHIFGRKGNELGVVNIDGSASHNTKMRISKKDAETLRGQGFDIRKDRVVEWIRDPDLKLELLLG